MGPKRCTRCVLPETYPDITFDNDGVCTVCLSFKKEEPLGDDELQKVISIHKAEDYHCLVPISGGRDSTFVLYVATKILNLKVLAFNNDNAFCHEQALNNMRRACEILNVDFLRMRSKRDIATKMVRAHLMASIPFGPGAVQQRLCWQCYHGAKGAIYGTAIKKQIPLIIWGFSRPEELTFQDTVKKHLDHVRPIRQLFSSQGLYCLKWAFYTFLEGLEFPVPGNHPFSLRPPVLKNKEITEISLFDYIEWDRRKIKKTIAEELGWEKPENAISSWRFDCHLHHMVNYCYRKILGFNHNLDGYANMVRTGKMSRDTAIKQIEAEESKFDEGEIYSLLSHRLKLPHSLIAKFLDWKP